MWRGGEESRREGSRERDDEFFKRARGDLDVTYLLKTVQKGALAMFILNTPMIGNMNCEPLKSRRK